MIDLDVVVLTGAGVSAESGVPTFRDAQTGLWARYDPRELATPEAFERDPGLVWKWYAWRRELVSRARPNAAHLALAALERGARRAGATIIDINPVATPIAAYADEVWTETAGSGAGRLAAALREAVRRRA